MRHFAHAGTPVLVFLVSDEQRVLWQVVLRPKSWNFSGLTQFT